MKFLSHVISTYLISWLFNINNKVKLYNLVMLFLHLVNVDVHSIKYNFQTTYSCISNKNKMLVTIIKKFCSFSAYRVYQTRCNRMRMPLRRIWQLWQDTWKIAVSIIQKKNNWLTQEERRENIDRKTYKFYFSEYETSFLKFEYCKLLKCMFFKSTKRYKYW